MTPIDFKNNYHSTHGAGFSIAPNFSQSAWFRYHNKDPHIDNLFFAAGHPGAGIPGVLSSAKVVENLANKGKFMDYHINNAKSVLKKNGKSFYWAGKLLTEEYINRASLLYCFYRALDDIADSGKENALNQLNSIRLNVRKKLFSN